MNSPAGAPPNAVLKQAVRATELAERHAEAPTATHWATLGPGEEETGPETFEELLAIDNKRKELLQLAKSHSPMTTALKVRLLPRTVLPRRLRHYLTWVVILTFVGTCIAARLGITEDDIDADVFDGAGTMVVFMIIFYVGYCYNR